MRTKVVAVHRSATGSRQHVLEAAETDRATVDAVQACFLEQRHDLPRIDVTVPVKVREKPLSILRVREIDDQHAPFRFEHAVDLSHTLLADLAWQVMEHQRVQDHVELRIGERQRLGDRVLECDVDACLRRLRDRACDHLGRRVDPGRAATRANPSPGSDRQGARSAPDIEHGFAASKMREGNQFFAEGAVPAVGQEPDEQVVARRPMEHATGSRGYGISCCCHAPGSVDWEPDPVKNTHPPHVRNRTSSAHRPETPDRRVQKTKTSLHDALLGLTREKPYASIAVKEILDRANVGRSTFYTHFRDKDDLLESGLHEVLQSFQGRPAAGSTLERVVAFSLPLLQHIDEHRRTAGPKMRSDGRVVVHEHLQDVLANLIENELDVAVRQPHPATSIPAALLARHVATTFVVVLDWWVESEPSLSPSNVNARFRALVVPAVRDFLGEPA